MSAGSTVTTTSTAVAPAPRAPDGPVFISYARADDERPPYEDTAEGWVRFFWAQLRWELTDRGAKRARLWLDRYEIEPAEAFTAKIESAVKQSALLVPIFSENWVQSEWCRLELATFVQVHSDAGSRIVPIFKNEPPPGSLPEVMQGESAREGYRFFVRDPTGRVRDFYWRGLQDRTAYFDVLKEIAVSVMKRLDLPTPPRKPEAATARTVFLAVAAPDLCDARQRLVNDLTAAGVTVVPTVATLPDTVDDSARVIRDALTRGSLAVHLLGEDRGLVPGGGREPTLDLQLRLSREAAAARSLPRILWAPRWLPGERQGKRDPFSVVSRFGGIKPGEEMYGEEVTDLSQWLRRRLLPTPAANLIVASAVKDDDELVAELANLLQGLGPAVKVIFAGDARAVPGKAPVVLILWAKADRAALDALVAGLPAGARITCLQLPGGDEAAKRTFFKEGVFREKIEALPGDRQQARGLLRRLGITPGDDLR